jgi:hypothetical protein
MSVPPYFGVVAAGVVVGLIVGVVVGVVDDVEVGVVDGVEVGVVEVVGWPQEARSSKITMTQLVTRNAIFAFIFPLFLLIINRQYIFNYSVVTFNGSLLRTRMI